MWVCLIFLDRRRPPLDASPICVSYLSFLRSDWSPTHSIDGKTPYEVWHGAKPLVHFLRTYGYIAPVKQGSKRLRKLYDRTTPIVFIGYKASSKAWRFYDLATRRVHVLRDAIFEEDKHWSWDGEEISDEEPFTMEYVPASGANRVGDVVHLHTPQVAPAPAHHVPSVHTPPAPPANEVVEFASPPTASPDLDAEAEDAPLRFRRVDGVL
jgi:hypothetical protein